MPTDRFAPRLALACLALCCALLAGLPATAQEAVAEPAPDPAAWRTVAETSDFRATSSYDETIEFLQRLDRALPELELGFYGTSAAGRQLPMVVLSNDHSFPSKRAKRSGRPVVMIVAGIHSGEIDGKDALLRILRDLVLGEGREILDAAEIVLVPIYNVDGHERVSPHNRPNQVGPEEGMGFRTTAQGLDLNRDWLKVDSPEARALVTLVAGWEPHLVVDVHVTDGAEHGWTLTTAWAEAPQLAEPAADWLDAHLPDAMAATIEAGWASGPYVSLSDRSDPTKGFSSNVHQPRYSTGYFPLRNTPVVLVETHARKPYRDRVLATEVFLRALLAEVGEDPAALTAAVAAAGSAVAGRAAGDERQPLVVTWQDKEEGEPKVLPLRPWQLEPSTVLGVPSLTYDVEAPYRDVEMPWVHGLVPDLSLPRPAGYLVPPGWPQITDRLRRHGVRAETFESAAELEVIATRVSDPQLADAPYQGRARLSATIARGPERHDFPVGTVWVPADQPLFELAAQLLEPEAEDSLFAWGSLSSVVERKEYVEVRVLDAWVEERLAADETLAAEWEKALEDEAFAANPGARYEWWSRRHPSWDDTVGLLPFFRLNDAAALSGVTRRAWR